MSIRKVKDNTWLKPKQCKHLEHNPPGYIDLRPGTYIHKCPGCGKEQTLTIQDYECA
jgi:hypothetical protein